MYPEDILLADVGTIPGFFRFRDFRDVFKCIRIGGCEVVVVGFRAVAVAVPRLCSKEGAGELFVVVTVTFDALLVILLVVTVVGVVCGAAGREDVVE